MRCPRGSATPLLVDDGYTANATGQQVACSVGHFCQGGVEKPCRIGHFQTNTGAVNCVTCPRGKFQNATGQTSCVDLTTPGFYTVNGIKLACPPGKFNDRTGGLRPCSSCTIPVANPWLF